jgi:HK97 family phage prohead protease
METTAFALRDVKLAVDPAAMSFEGYGAVFGNVDSYGDVIAPGAFRDTLDAARKTGLWPAMLSQHGGFLGGDSQTPVGVWTAMEEDSIGLKVAGQLAPTARGQEIHALLKMQPRPAFNGLSIGFIAKKWSVRTRPEEPRRTLEAVDLMEVSLVTFPANGKARVTDVKAAEHLTRREFEALLREKLGFSRAQAERVSADGHKGLSPRDAEPGSLAEIIRRNIATLS